jgi:hypothetical protein
VPPCADGEEDAATDPAPEDDGLGAADVPADGDADVDADVEADDDGVGAGVEPPAPSSSQSVQNTLCFAAPFSPSKFQNSL